MAFVDQDDAGAIKVSRKYFTLRVILFAVAIVAAIGGITYAIISATKLDPGVYTITASPDKENPYNNQGVQGSFYFGGSSGEIKALKNATTELLNKELRAASYRLDETKTYEISSSIGAVNAKIGEEVTVDERVYAVLLDAYNKSKEDNNFSIFAAPLFDAWKDVLNDASHENDPLRNATYASYLEKLTGIIADQSNYDLLFLGEGKVKLTLSAAYQAFRTEYEITSPVISLNSLHDAYLLKEVQSAFEKQGFKDGVLFTLTGSLASIEPSHPTTYGVLDKDAGKVLSYGAFDISKSAVVASAIHFTQSESSYLYNPSYDIAKDGVTYHRSLYLNLGTGMPNNDIAASYIKRDGNDIVGASLDLVSLEAKTFEEIKASGKDGLLFTSWNESKKAYIASAAKSGFKLDETSHYSLTTI